MNKFAVPFTPLEAHLPDPGNGGSIDLGVYQSASCALTSLTGETRFLLAPSRVTQRVTLWMDAFEDEVILTVNNPVAGLTTITFNDLAFTAQLIAITVAGEIKWKQLAV